MIAEQTSLDTFQMLWKVIAALIIIIGLFYLIMKFLSQKNRSLWLKTPVRSLGGTALGQGKSLQIVEIGRSLYVIGVGDNVQLLDKIEDAVEIAHIMESLQGKKTSGLSISTHPERSETKNFRQVFQSKLHNISGRNQEIQKWIEENNAK